MLRVALRGRRRRVVGRDAVVPGWFYNLGITGLSVQLAPNAPRTLVVKYVFPGSPATGLL